MAYGVKVKLDVDVDGKALRSKIQSAIEQATQGKPVKIRHLDIELGRQEAKRISSQLESAIASQELTIKIARIDASKPVEQLRKQLTTMLSGLSITGLKDFVGTEGIGNAYEKAAKAADKLAEAQENIRKKTVETSAALKVLNSLQTQLNSINSKSFRNVNDGGELSQYTEQYRELTAAIENAKTLSGEAQEQEVARITQATIALKRQTDATIENERAAKKAAEAVKDSAKAQNDQEAADKKAYTTLARAIQLRQRINTWINNNTRAYKANKAEIDDMLATLQDESTITDAITAKIDKDFKRINATTKASGLAGKAFFQTLQEGWKKFGGWSLVTKSMMTAVNTVKDMIAAVKELDAAMTELKKVTDLTDQAYSMFMDRAASVAKSIGATLADTINAVADFSRLGYGIDDATALAEAALVYKNVGDGIDDVSVATESLISTMKAFGYEADDAMSIVDKFNQVGNNFAISSSGIGDALQRSASSMAAAGNTLEETIGLITAMNNVIQNPDVVGTALKTVSMYLRAAKTEAEAAGESTEGMANSVSELRKELLDLTGQKVDIMIDENTFKSTYQIMKELSVVWNDLTDTTRANILELIGGKRNANAVTSLLKNFSDAEKAMKSAMEAMGSATAENEKYLDSINGKMATLRASFEELSASVISSGLVKTVLDIGIGITNILTGLQKIHMLLPAITALLTLIRGINNGRKAGNAIDSIMAAVNNGTESDKLRLIAAASTEKLTMAQKSLMKSQIETYVATGKLNGELAKQIINAGGLGSAMTSAGAAGKTFATVIKGIGKAFLSWQGVLLVIEVLYGVVRDAIDRNNQKVQESIDKANEVVSAYEDAEKTYAKNAKTLNELSSEFNRLSKGVNENGENIGLTADEYDTYLSIIDQLIEISPDIVREYDSQRGAIVDYHGALNEAIESQQTWLENQKAIKLAGGDTLIDGKKEELREARRELDDFQTELFGSMFDFSNLSGKHKKAAERAASDAIWGENGLLNTLIDTTYLGDRYTDTGEIGEFYDNLIELYERRDEVIAFARNSKYQYSFGGDVTSNLPLFSDEQIEGLEGQFDKIGAIISKMRAAKDVMVDWYDLWAQDRGLYEGIPKNAVDNAREAFYDLYDPDDMEKSKTAIQDYLDTLRAAFRDDPGVKNILSMADGLKDGTTSIEEYNAAVLNFIKSNNLQGFTLITVVSYLRELSIAIIKNRGIDRGGKIGVGR